MNLKPPKDDAHYAWTSHVFQKMLHYGIGEGRIRRIVRAPERVEEGIAENTIAAMQSSGTKGNQEIWVMYKLADGRKETKPREKGIANYFLPNKKIKVITAWRYPGKSPKRNPIPQEILAEVRQLL